MMARYIVAFALVVSLARVANGELTPQQVAIVAMARSQQSRSLAEYYANARGIPASQILLLDGEPGETMARQLWHGKTRPAIRAWLKQNDLEANIRCFVTCWDVPLRIDKLTDDSPELSERGEFLRNSRAILVQQFTAMLDMLDSLAPGQQPPERAAVQSDVDLQALSTHFDAALKAAQLRIHELSSEEQKKPARAALERGFLRGGGITAYLGLIARQHDVSKLTPEAAQKIEQLKGRLAGLGEGLLALGRLPDTVARDAQVLELLQKSTGLLGTIRWIDQQQQRQSKNETYASFDSELSLLLWPDYPLDGRQLNLLQYRYDQIVSTIPATLMVSRLEAPTFERAKNLVDAAIDVEQKGLAGKVYLDARGIQFDPDVDKPGSLGAFDQSLRDLADRLKKHTTLEVIVNEEAKVFQAGDCPDAALYCGWYSLAKYVDAFDWRPGAVGYHLASSEATTLRTPGSEVWCNAMLEDGIGATLGPVHEPYLTSFPLPDDFFSLLLTGRYSLVEVYYRTKPHNSWAMVLVGDPLYNPFKNDPPLSEDALPQRLQAKPVAASQPQ